MKPLEAVFEGETVIIPLSRGLVSIIDAKNWDLVKDKKFHARYDKKAKKFYGQTCKKVRVEGKIHSYYTQLHRLIMGLTDPSIQCDHKNNDGLDNREQNLRVASNSQNCANCKKQEGRSSKYKGVYWRANRNHWVAQVVCDGKRYHLKCHKDEEAAARAYDKKALEVFGEFAKLNFPESKPESTIVINDLTGEFTTN